MTLSDYIQNEYFEWMYDIVGGNRQSPYMSYRKLLMYLHDVEFRYSNHRDEARSYDGIDLRRHYEIDTRREISDYIDGPCSVLEMMVALAIRCEDIMDNPNYGNRTGQWFWGMIINLGLGSMTDGRFNRDETEEIIESFLNRKYARDGQGGLFTVKDTTDDFRKLEITHQMYRYLNSIS